MKKSFIVASLFCVSLVGGAIGASFANNGASASADETTTVGSDLNSLAKEFDERAGVEWPTGSGDVDISGCEGPLAGKIVFCDTIYTCYAFSEDQINVFTGFGLSSNLYDRYKKVMAEGYRWTDSKTGATFVSTYGKDCGVSFRFGGNAKVYDFSSCDARAVFKDGIPADSFKDPVSTSSDYGTFYFYEMK